MNNLAKATQKNKTKKQQKKVSLVCFVSLMPYAPQWHQAHSPCMLDATVVQLAFSHRSCTHVLIRTAHHIAIKHAWAVSLMAR
jgi:hypothetical protein